MIGHDLIKEIGIEKARAIVEGAPKSAYEWRTNRFYYTKCGMYYCTENKQFFKSWSENAFKAYVINDLRTAIEHHYYGRSEAEELAAYAELSQEKIEGGAMLVGDFSEAKKIIDKQLESDHVTDITNHISPNTKVVEL